MSLTPTAELPTEPGPCQTLDLYAPFEMVSRHRPILRPCLGQRDSALLLASCARSDRPRDRRSLRSLLLLTRHRLVVTSESALFRRLRLHLNAELNQLSEVAWIPDPTHCGVQLAATAIDGAREYLWIFVGLVDRVWKLDALLHQSFVVCQPAVRTVP